MTSFYMNGYLWHIKYVDPNDPALIDISGRLSVATTDGEKCIIFLSKDLIGDFKTKVLIHELGHCAMFSFHLIDEIHKMVYPEYRIEVEEWVCNFIADYGMQIFKIASNMLGSDGWICIPKELERLIA